MIKKLFALLSVLFLLNLFSGCASLRTPPEKPEVSLAGLSLVKVGVFEQEFKVKLRVQNPNNFDLPLEGLNVQLKLNDQPFIKAMSNQKVTIPKLSSTVVEVDAVSTLANLSSQVGGFFKSDVLGVRYSLTGKVHVIRPMISLPVEKQGEISLKGIIPGL